MDLDDSLIIRRSVTDPPLFAAIFDRHFGRIHRYLARRAGTEAADDLAAEVFAVAFARRERFDSERGEMLPWLYGIASNVLLADGRARRRAVALLPRAWQPDLTAPFEERAGEAIDARRQARTLKALFGRLSEAEISTLLLYAWEELTYEQVAEALEVPVGTVRSRLNRIRRKADEPLLDQLTSTGCPPDEPEGERP